MVSTCAGVDKIFFYLDKRRFELHTQYVCGYINKKCAATCGLVVIRFFTHGFITYRTIISMSKFINIYCVLPFTQQPKAVLSSKSFESSNVTIRVMFLAKPDLVE
jgi:hypothetical protein